MLRRLIVLLVGLVSVAALVTLPQQAKADVPSRGWIDISCTAFGNSYVLTTYHLDSLSTTPLNCGASSYGWTHIVQRHGEAGTGTRWPAYKFGPNPNLRWESMMDFMTQATLLVHDQGIYRSPQTGAVSSRCFQQSALRLDQNTGSLIVIPIIVIIKGQNTRITTSYIGDQPGAQCQGFLEPGSGADARSSDVEAASASDPVRAICGLTDGGCYAHFSGNRSVYTSNNTSARVIQGALKNRWAAMNWERSFLKYPTTSERCGFVRGGCFNHMQGGSIYYSPATGAWPIGGAFRTAWSNEGWERSPLGYPASMERHPGNGAPSAHRIQDFEYGFLYWDGANVTGEWTPPGCPSCRAVQKTIPV